MRKQVFGTILFVFVLMSAGLALAQSTIPYEGRLTAPAGTRLGQDTATIRFSIWDDPNIGTERWSEVQDTVRLDNGVFNVQLGSVAGSPAYLFTGSLLYLQIEIGGEVLRPRQTISAVPYAIQALNGPGIAREYNPTILEPLGGTVAYDTLTITVPTSGFIVLQAHALFFIDHTAGADDLVRLSISRFPATIDFDNAALWRVNPNNPTNLGSNEGLTQNCTKVEAVSAGTHTYYLNADRFSGTSQIWRWSLTAMFFPNAYGTVISTVSSPPGFFDPNSDNGVGPKKEEK